jgi:PAS domain S-box-containing protein
LLSWDDTYEEMLGVKADASKGPGHFIDPYFRPDDGARVLREYATAEDEKRGVNHEFRIVLSNGDVRYIHEVSEIELDAGGRPVAYFGTLQNITERKLRDAELERSRRQLADAAHRAKLVYRRH